MFSEAKITKPTKIMFMFVYEVPEIKEVYILHVETYAVFFSQIDEKYFWSGVKPFMASPLLLVLQQRIALVLTSIN